MDLEALSTECSRLEASLKKAIRSKRVPKDHVAILEAAALEVCELEHLLVAAGPHALLWSSFLHHLWRQIPGPEEVW